MINFVLISRDQVFNLCIYYIPYSFVKNFIIFYVCKKPINFYFYKQVVLEPRVSPEHTSKYVDTVTVFAKT